MLVVLTLVLIDNLRDCLNMYMYVVLDIKPSDS